MFSSIKTYECNPNLLEMNLRKINIAKCKRTLTDHL